MILASLRNLAEAEGLTTDLDYEPKPVTWICLLDGTGNLLGVTSTAVAPIGKAKPLAKTMQIPRRVERTVNDKAAFLVDKPEYVLGLLDESGLNASRQQKVELRRRLFLQHLQDAARVTNHQWLVAIRHFLQSDSLRSEAANHLKEQGYASNDLVCFEIGGHLVHESQEVRTYFSTLRACEGNETAQCTVCGENRVPVKKHPSVQLRGGSSSGIALVSFNKAAFESYGWDGGENAPVCRNCAEGYTTGLRRLISYRYPDPLRPGEFLPKRSVGLSNDTTAVFWADVAVPGLDWFADVFEKPDPEAVNTVLESPWSGSAPANLSARFYCLLLSGAQGRAIVRGTHTGVLSDVEANVKEYFSVVASISERPLPLYLLLRSLAVLGKADNLPPSLAGDIFLAILFALPYPRLLLSAAIQRCRAEQQVTRERATIVQLYFQRNEKRQEFIMGLNRELPDTGYRLGRLLAVLERLQSGTNRNLNRTIVDRYYGAASTRPVTVFPSLLHLAQHHAAKLDKSGFFQKEIGDVLEAVPSFPPHLSLKEQGLFALGYYHQRQEYFKKRENAFDLDNTASLEGETISG